MSKVYGVSINGIVKGDLYADRDKAQEVVNATRIEALHALSKKAATLAEEAQAGLTDLSYEDGTHDAWDNSIEAMKLPQIRLRVFQLLD